MRYNTFVQYKRQAGDGAIEINGNEIVVFKKSAAVHYAFGAIGTAIAQGKEILRFSVNDIESYKIINRAFTDELCISLFNGESVTLGLKNDLKECILPILEKAVAENAEQKKVDAVFSEYSVHEKTTKDENQVYCRKCGSQLVAGSSFCRKCGTPIAETQAEKEMPLPTQEDSSANDQKPELEGGTFSSLISIPKTQDPKLKRAFLFLEDSDWESADKYFEEVLDKEPTNAYAYFGKALVELKINSKEGIVETLDELQNSKNYKKAERFGGPEITNEIRRITDTVYSDSNNRSNPAIYYRAQKLLNSANTKDAYMRAAGMFRSIQGYKDATTLVEKCLKEANAIRFSETIKQAKERMDEGTQEGYEAAEALFRTIPEWKDSQKMVLHCQNKAKELFEEKQKEEAQRLKAKQEQEASEKRTAHTRKIIAITIPSVIALLVFALVYFTAIIPNRKITQAKDYIAAGKYIEAYELLDGLNYKDSNKTMSEIQEKYHEQLFQNADVGRTVFFGSFEQDKVDKNGSTPLEVTVLSKDYIGRDPIEWIVLAKEKNKLLLISKKILYYDYYYSRFAGECTWETSALRKWLNDSGLFLRSFSKEELSLILTTRVENTGNSHYGTSGGHTTNDKVFVLSTEELEHYLPNASDRIATSTAFAESTRRNGLSNSWWLRTPGGTQRFGG